MSSTTVLSLSKAVGEILTFDRKGKFKSVFNRQGQGPEEYVHLDAFRLCNGLIYILDCDVRAISVYKTGGDFVRKIKLDSVIY